MYDGDREIYASMVEKVDEGVGMILSALEKHGIADNSWVVLSSDNGGERYSDNSPLFHHKSTLWEGGIHVPCLMRWPAKLPAGKTTDQVAVTMDLSRSFLSAVGTKPPADFPWDGIDLLPILQNNQPELERTLCWRIDRTGRQQKAVRHGDWKYLQDGNVELLFNLKEDIGERRDESYRRPDVFADLKQRLAAWEADLAKSPTEFLVK